jgi:RNA polymerase sigma factor (sigma-70 family)
MLKQLRPSPLSICATQFELAISNPIPCSQRQCMDHEVGMMGLAALFDEHRADLLRFLAARSGDFSASEDLLSDLWLKVQAVPTGPIDNGRAYLFRMANNLVLDRVRAQLRRVRREQAWTDDRHGAAVVGRDLSVEAAPADERMIDEQERLRLHDAILLLPPGARRVLQLHKLEELSHQEVATRLGISKSAVEKHMAVAIAHLRKHLADCGDD